MGAPLGTIPVIQEHGLYIHVENRSDMWNSPYKFKDGPLRMTEGQIRLPVLQTETWKASVDLEGDSLSFGRTDFALGKKQVFLGSNLRSSSVGFGFRKSFADGSALTAHAAYATASDEPYGDTRDIWIEGVAIYAGPPIERHRWIFAVNQSNNRGIENGRPFPFIGVLYERDRDFTALFGFPFLRLIWGHSEECKHLLNFTPFGARYEIEKNLSNDFVLNAFAAFSVRSYLHEQRIDENDRLFYQEWTLETSLRKNVSDETGVIFGIGYSFERLMYESETLYSPNSPSIRLNNDIYGRVGVEFRL